MYQADRRAEGLSVTVELLLVLELTFLFIKKQIKKNHSHDIFAEACAGVFEGSGTFVWFAVFVNTVVKILDIVILSYHFTFSIKTKGQYARYLSASFHSGSSRPQSGSRLIINLLTSPAHQNTAAG